MGRRSKQESLGALAAAVALACGAASGQGVGDSPNPAEDEQVINQQERPTEQSDDGLDQEEREQLAVLQEEQQERLEESEQVEQRRQELAQMADEAIERLRSEQPGAEDLLGEAHGYAVFDTTKGGLIVTGAGGSGVAREQGSGEETFMHLGSVGAGVGAGLENYKLVMLFEDQETYDAFVTGQWDGSIAAQAAAGDEGAAAEEQFVEGIRIYRMTDAGLIAQIDVSGIRFWPSDKLNEA